MQAGKAAAAGLLGKKCDLLVNPKVMVPSWTEAGARLGITEHRLQQKQILVWRMPTLMAISLLLIKEKAF